MLLDFIIGMGIGFFDEVDLNSKLTNKDKKRGKETVTNLMHNIYKASMVIGTSCVFDYGKYEKIVRKGKKGAKTAVLPILFYRGDSPSFIERCIGLVDDIHLAVYKIRELFVKLPPAPRMTIDLSLLQDTIRIGKKDYDIMQMDKMFYRTGRLYHRSRGEFQDMQAGSNRPPINPVPVDVLTDFQMFHQEIATKMDQIRMVTGINEVADGSSQNAEMLKGVLEGLNAATNNALKPLYQSLESLHKRLYRYVIKLWQLQLLETGDIRITYQNNRTIKVLSLGKGLAYNEFGIVLTVLPTEEKKMFMLQNLAADKAQGKVGEADYFVLLNMIEQNDFKKAQFYYVRAVEKAKAAEHQRQLEMIQAQGQQIAQQAQVAEQAKGQTLQMKGQNELEQIQLDKDLERRNKKEEIILNNSYDDGRTK